MEPPPPPIPTGRTAALPVTGRPFRARTKAESPPKLWDKSEPTRLDDDELSEPVATPPGAGAVRGAAVPVLDALPVAIRLRVDVNSSPENILPPDALVGPDDPLELLDPLEPDDEEPLDVPPPDDEPDEEEDPLVVRGTA